MGDFEICQKTIPNKKTKYMVYTSLKKSYLMQKLGERRLFPP